MTTIWKKYGGSVDLLNNLTVGTIVADSLSLNNFYLGNWDICGGLRVKDNGLVSKNMDICGNLAIGNNVNINGQLTLSRDAVFNGNLVIYNDVYMTSNIYFDPNGKTLLHANAGGFGFNRYNPIATMDISSDRVQTIYLKSSATSNRNVIAQNVNSHGIVVNANDASAEINMFVDTSMNIDGTGTPNAKLKYTSGGDFYFDVSNVLHIKPRVVFSADLSDNMNSNQEQITIYDSSEQRGVSYPYLYDIYNDTNLKTGLAFTALSRDTSSNVFFKLTSTAGRGFVVGGGAGAGGSIMGSLALTDTTNSDFSRYMYPAINFFSGDLLRQLKTTVAFNKFNPSKKPDGVSNLYALDVNGPTKILHQELLNVADVSMDIFNIVINSSNPLIGYAACGPATVSYPFKHYLLKTVNGGFTWSPVDIASSDLESGTANILSVFTSPSNTNFSVLGGEGGALYYSNNNATSFNKVSYTNGNSTFNINSIVNVSDNRFVFALTDNPTGSRSGKYFDITSFPVSSINITANRRDTSLNDLLAIDGSGSLLVFAGAGGLQFYNTSTYSLSSPYLTTNTFNDVSVYYDGSNYHAVAVGLNGAIAYFHGSTPSSWSLPMSSPSGNFNAVRVINSMYAIAVGQNGLVAYSNNGFSTWVLVSANELNAMGNGLLLYNYNLIDIAVAPDDHFFISTSYQSFITGSQNARTKIFDLHAPYFFNRSNKSVLDVSGSIRVSGDININEAGNLLTNNSSISIFPHNATSIIIGNSIIGGNTIVNNNFISVGNITAVADTTVNKRLFVTDDVSLSSNLFVNGNTVINKKLVVANDVSFGANLFIDGNVVINKRLDVSENVLFGANLLIKNQLNVSGNAFINGFIDSSNNTLTIGASNANNIVIGANNSCSTLFIGSNGSRGTNIDVFIGDGNRGNVHILGNLFVPGTITVENQVNMEITNKNIVLNDNGSFGSSSGAGILIYDGGVTNAGQIIVNSYRNGLLLKSPASSNIINVDVAGLALSNGSTKGICTIVPTSNGDGSNFTLSTSIVDISNINLLDVSLNGRLQRNNVATLTQLGGTQIIDTPISVTRMLVAKREATAISGADLDLSGNAFVSRLGVGTSSVNSSFALDVLGNVNLTGRIVQW